jgi:toxin ParE1/3/4
MPSQYRVIYSPRASTDLHAISATIEKDSPQNAAAVMQQIVDAIDSLNFLSRRHPVASGARNKKGETRVMPVSSYLIFYRIIENETVVQLITIRHGARRRPKRFE